ncbi:MAG: hypothetical protein AAB575_01645 [Patescibacteria group bacterium]
MNLLISTEAKNLFSLAIGDSEIKKIRVVRKEYRHAELLLREIDRLIRKSKINNIFVVQGPGAFSALRIGLAVGNALAYGWSARIVGIEIKEEWNNLSENDRLNKIWQAGIKQLMKVKNKKLKFVEPVYGREPNITMKQDKRDK